MNRASAKTTKRIPVQKTQKATKAFKQTKRSIATKKRVVKRVTPTKKTTLSLFSSTLSTPVFQSAPRFFSAHASASPDTWGPQEPEYNDVQTEKYGKQKYPRLFPSDTPTFHKMVKPIDFEGEIIGSRPVAQQITAQEYCAKFGIVLVDHETAHCQGTTDGPHPQQFIQVYNSQPNKPVPCKYCGTRFLHRDSFDGSSIPYTPEH